MKVNKKRAAAGEGTQFFRPRQEGVRNFSALVKRGRAIFPPVKPE